MLLSYVELCELVGQGVIENVRPEQINGTSIDLTLATDILLEMDPAGQFLEVDLSAKPRQYPQFAKLTIDETGLILPPGGFCLAATEQLFNLPPDISSHYFLNSSLARGGLDASLAMWCDPNWNGSALTLEFKNATQYHYLRLRPGMKCGQMVFHRVTPVPQERSYAVRGSYNQKGSGPVTAG
jgi:deoxycytidine triphosphate deaminase